MLSLLSYYAPIPRRVGTATAINSYLDGEVPLPLLVRRQATEVAIQLFQRSCICS